MVSREERGARNSDALAKYKVCGGGLGLGGLGGGCDGNSIKVGKLKSRL